MTPTKSLSERLREACQKGAEDIEPWQCNPYLFGEAADALDAKDALTVHFRYQLDAKDALLAQAAAALEQLLSGIVVYRNQAREALAAIRDHADDAEHP